MRYVFGAIAAFVLALVQASSIEQFHVLGVAPNLMLVLLTSWLVVRGLDDVLPMIAVAGITMGFIGLQTPGLVLLAMLLPLALLGVVRELHVLHSEVLLVLLLTGAATAAYESLLLLGAMATGGVLDPAGALTGVIVPAAVVNVALTPPVYAVMRLARPGPERRFSF